MIANKMTQSEKRGYQTAKHSNREYHNDRRNLDPVQPRPASQLRAAQEKLAALALDKDEPAAWLSDVLSALGLHRVISPS